MVGHLNDSRYEPPPIDHCIHDDSDSDGGGTGMMVMTEMMVVIKMKLENERLRVMRCPSPRRSGGRGIEHTKNPLGKPRTKKTTLTPLQQKRAF